MSAHIEDQFASAPVDPIYPLPSPRRWTRGQQLNWAALLMLATGLSEEPSGPDGTTATTMTEEL